MAIDYDGEGEYVELGYGHWIEALQTAHIVHSNHQEFLVDHPAIKQTPSLAAKADAICVLLGELYQSISQAANGSEPLL